MKRLTDRIRAKFNVAVAEVGGQDSWQRAVVGLTVVTNEGAHAEAMLRSVARFAEELYVAQLTEIDIDLVHYDDDEALGASASGLGDDDGEWS